MKIILDILKDGKKTNTLNYKNDFAYKKLIFLIIDKFNSEKNTNIVFYYSRKEIFISQKINDCVYNYIFICENANDVDFFENLAIKNID